MRTGNFSKKLWHSGRLKPVTYSSRKFNDAFSIVLSMIAFISSEFRILVTQKQEIYNIAFMLLCFFWLSVPRISIAPQKCYTYVKYALPNIFYEWAIYNIETDARHFILTLLYTWQTNHVTFLFVYPEPELAFANFRPNVQLYSISAKWKFV